jgi:hypothetical protein
MAKIKLSKLLPSLESEDGVAHSVDVKEESAELSKAEVQQVADDGSGKGDVAEAAFEVEVDGKDFTAIDEASKRQGEVIAKQLERLEEAQVSTESYIRILRGQKRHGVDSGTAAVIKHDLTSQYPKFFAGVIPALEDFDDEDKRVAVTEQTGKRLDGRLDKLKETAKKAIEKFLAMMREGLVKFKAAFEKIKSYFTGIKKKSEDMAKVIAALPGPGGKVNPSALGQISDTSGLKSASALLELKGPMPEPPKKYTIRGTTGLITDGKLDLDSTDTANAFMDYMISYYGGIGGAFNKAIEHIKGLIANPPATTFNNEADAEAVTAIIESTLGKLTIPTGTFAGGQFEEKGTPGKELWIYKHGSDDSSESDMEIDLPSKQELEKIRASIDTLSDKTSKVMEASEKANAEFEKYSAFLSQNKEKCTFSMSAYILLPVSIRTNSWAIVNHIQIVTRMRMFVADGVALSMVRGNQAEAK